MTPEQAAYAKKNNFSDHLPRQRQVWFVEEASTQAECETVLNEAVAEGGYIFHVMKDAGCYEVVWWKFED